MAKKCKTYMIDCINNQLQVNPDNSYSRTVDIKGNHHNNTSDRLVPSTMGHLTIEPQEGNGELVWQSGRTYLASLSFFVFFIKTLFIISAEKIFLTTGLTKQSD